MPPAISTERGVNVRCLIVFLYKRKEYHEVHPYYSLLLSLIVLYCDLIARLVSIEVVKPDCVYFLPLHLSLILVIVGCLLDNFYVGLTNIH